MKRLFVIMLCALILFLSGCSDTEKLEGGQPEEPVVKNGEIAARQGDWVYYINGSNSFDTDYDFTYGAAIKGALCRVNSDRSVKNIVIPQIIISFTIKGEWIYYMTPKGESEEDRRLIYCKTRIDGTGHKEIEDITDYMYFNMHEDYVYFTLNDKFYRSDHDLKNRKEIVGTLIHNALFVDDYIYYTTANYNSVQDVYYPTQLNVVKNDGSENKLIEKGAFYLDGATDKYLVVTNATNGYTLLVDRDTLESEVRLYVPYEQVTVSSDGKYLILNNIEESQSLKAYNIETRKTEVLFKNGAKLPIEYDGMVYFYNSSDDNKIYRVPIDASGEAELFYRYSCSTELTLQILDNYLYFFNNDDGGAVYRINMDTNTHEYIEFVRKMLD